MPTPESDCKRCRRRSKSAVRPGGLEAWKSGSEYSTADCDRSMRHRQNITSQIELLFLLEITPRLMLPLWPKTTSTMRLSRLKTAGWQLALWNRWHSNRSIGYVLIDWRDKLVWLGSGKMNQSRQQVNVCKTKESWLWRDALHWESTSSRHFKLISHAR